ncbi:hypothetical protein Vadar_025416 [Vaccinium darrowii]|uniref:Uncharacterized protein n=1 Tax=Vaccinium darrowii TaxID=229202 RepID=A0ACB7Y2W9_9ERIC|nr:hypothetical protein Vadar_025416 [Vaccinium darrowii]
MASSPSPSENQLIPRSEVDSQLSSLVFDLSQQVQAAMENMLKMITEIDENSAGIMEDIEKILDTISKDLAGIRTSNQFILAEGMRLHSRSCEMPCRY